VNNVIDNYDVLIDTERVTIGGNLAFKGLRVRPRCLALRNGRFNLFLRVRIITNSFIKSTLGLLVVLEIFHLFQTLFGCDFRVYAVTSVPFNTVVSGRASAGTPVRQTDKTLR
jgi:hypothetical protein